MLLELHLRTVYIYIEREIMSADVECLTIVLDPATRHNSPEKAGNVCPTTYVVEFSSLSHVGIVSRIATIVSLCGEEIKETNIFT